MLTIITNTTLYLTVFENAHQPFSEWLCVNLFNLVLNNCSYLCVICICGDISKTRYDNDENPETLENLTTAIKTTLNKLTNALTQIDAEFQNVLQNCVC